MADLETNPDLRALVARLASDEERWTAWARLMEAGLSAREAVREGLGHANWQVRRWCAIWLDHYADPESLHALIPLLRDPKSKVRLFAVHSIACERCKTGENPIDVVPLLIERIRHDESIRVRRHAVAMLASQHAHPDLEGFFQELLDTETDAKLHKHAGLGLMMCRSPGIATHEAARMAAKALRKRIDADPS
jgi:HEAT repeat protein